jgi:hypothetical protein
MTKSDKTEEIKALKKALGQERRKNKTLEEKYKDIKRQNKILKCDSKKKQQELILSSLPEDAREIIELLFPDTDSEK